jgi:hypothetical protein
MITLTEDEWSPIYNRIAREYPASYLLNREVQRRELGFNVRRHKEWHHREDLHLKDVGYRVKYQTSSICLDFYDDAKETWFRMKYL